MFSYSIIAQASPSANPLAMFLPLILIFVVFYIFIIRPQKKKEDGRKKMIGAVKKGDRIVTIGGIHATVNRVDEQSVLAQVDGELKLRFEKSAIASIVTKDNKKDAGASTSSKKSKKDANAAVAEKENG